MVWSKIKKVLTAGSKRINLVFVCFVLLLGFCLRLYNLEDYPKGFHPKEALTGYRSFLLLNDHRDETGRNFPLFFTSFQDYQLPVPTYITIPFIKALGLNKNAVRLPFALVSSFSLLCFYLLVRHFFPNEPRVAIFALLFFSLSPGNLFLSRFASENNLSLNIFIIGLTFFLLVNRNWSFVLGSLLFVVVIFTSKISWFILPPLLALTVISVKDKLLKRKLFIAFLIVLSSLAILLVNYFKLPGAKRSFIENDLNLFNNLAISNGINSLRGQDIGANNQYLGKLLHNKLFYLIKISENFVQQFTPRFLFAAGDKDPFHGLSNTGPLFLFLLPLVIFGLMSLAGKSHKKVKYLFIIWAIFSLPSIFVLPTPDEEKSVFVYPLLITLSSIGLLKTKNKLILIVLTIFALMNVSFVFYDGLYKEPVRGQKKWAYGIEEAARIIRDGYPEYRTVYFTDAYASDPGPIILFYLNSSGKGRVAVKNINSINYRQWIKEFGVVKIGLSENATYPDEGKYGLVFTPEDEKKYFKTIGEVFRIKNGEVCQKLVKKKIIKGLDDSILLIYAENETIKCPS